MTDESRTEAEQRLAGLVAWLYQSYPRTVEFIEAEAARLALEGAVELVRAEQPTTLKEPFDFGFAEGIRASLAAIEKASR